MWMHAACQNMYIQIALFELTTRHTQWPCNGHSLTLNPKSSYPLLGVNPKSSDHLLGTVHQAGYWVLQYRPIWRDKWYPCGPTLIKRDVELSTQMLSVHSLADGSFANSKPDLLHQTSHKHLKIERKWNVSSIVVTSALSLAFSMRSCCSSVEMAASLVVVAMPQLGQQALFMVSLMPLFSSLSFSISVFNNEFSCRSCIACKNSSHLLTALYISGVRIQWNDLDESIDFVVKKLHLSNVLI